MEPRGSVTELAGGQEETVAWPSCETRPDCDYADTASVSEFPDSNYQVARLLLLPSVDCGIWN